MSGKDIDGWYRTSVFWEPVTGMNLQQKTAVAYEGKMARLWSGHRAMEIAGVDDPSGMQRAIEQEMLKEARVQAEAQQIMQGGTAPPGGGGAPGAQPSPPPGGGGAPPQQGGSAQPAPMVMRPKGLGQSAPSPGGQPAMGITLDTVRRTLTIVLDTLKSTVAAVGELAKTGQSAHVEVVVSDHRDYPRVAPLLKALDPQAKISVKSEKDWPENAVRIA
jgi:hypothetical protein